MFVVLLQLVIGDFFLKCYQEPFVSFVELGNFKF
jgi:hypothetical protein